MIITSLTRLSPKQKALLKKLDKQGVKYKLKTVDGRTTIVFENQSFRYPDYDSDDYLITDFDLAAGEWGD